MKILLAFLGLCLAVGLWVPPKQKLGGLIAGGAVLLVLFFLISPHQM